MNQPEITLAEAQATVETKTAPRVTQAGFEKRIQTVEYIHKIGGLTLCFITMQNGWHLFGKSAPVSMENYDRKVGRRYAYEDAIRPLWQLEGYLLKETLYQNDLAAGVVPAAPPMPDDVAEALDTIPAEGAIATGFESALMAMRTGMKVRRPGWNEGKTVKLVGERFIAAYGDMDSSLGDYQFTTSDVLSDDWEWIT